MGLPRNSTPREEGFATLLAAARLGAPWACTAIWSDYAPQVMSFLAARGSREPEDLTSEVFLTVFDRLGTFEGDEPQLRSFIFSVAYRRLVDELRVRGRRGENLEWTPETDTRSSSSAEAVAVDRIGDEATLRLLEELVPDQRDVMVLRIVSDLTIEQVAEIVGKSPGAVKALQRRALESLRKKIERTRTPVSSFVDSAE